MLEGVTMQSPHVARAASRSVLIAASDRPSSLHFLLWSLTVCLDPSRSQETGAILRTSNARRTPWRTAEGTTVVSAAARMPWTMAMTQIWFSSRAASTVYLLLYAASEWNSRWRRMSSHSSRSRLRDAPSAMNDASSRSQCHSMA